MYGVPPDFDPGTLVGEELLQICVGQSDLILNFEPPASILVTSSIAYAPPGGASAEIGSLAEAGRILVALLGEKIVSASVILERTLRLEFGTGARVEIRDDSDRFESFTIRRGGDLIIV